MDILVRQQIVAWSPLPDLKSGISRSLSVRVRHAAHTYGIPSSDIICEYVRSGSRPTHNRVLTKKKTCAKLTAADMCICTGRTNCARVGGSVLIEVWVCVCVFWCV